MDTFHSIDINNLSTDTGFTDNIELVSSEGFATKEAISSGNIITVKGWTPELDKLLVKWFKQCEERAMCHRLDKNIYKKRDVYIFFPGVILNTVGSITSFVFSNYNLSFLPVLSGIFGILAIFVASLNKYFNFKGISVQHGFYFKQFFEIANDLKIIHAIERHNRPEGLTYMRKIKLRIDKLVEKSPDLTKRDKREMRLQIV
jgi:hypothetical protein